MPGYQSNGVLSNFWINVGADHWCIRTQRYTRCLTIFHDLENTNRLVPLQRIWNCYFVPAVLYKCFSSIEWLEYPDVMGSSVICVNFLHRSVTLISAHPLKDCCAISIDVCGEGGNKKAVLLMGLTLCSVYNLEGDSICSQYGNTGSLLWVICE